MKIYIFEFSKSKGKEGIKDMDNLKISGKLGIKKQLKASKNEKIIENGNPFSSNPFGISFKGKVLTGDLFTKSSLAERSTTILEKSKLAVSAAVASLVEIKNTWAQKLEPVINFVKQTNQHITTLAEKINAFKVENISLTTAFKKDKAPQLSRGAQKLVTKPVSELIDLWEEAIKKPALV